MSSVFDNMVNGKVDKPDIRFFIAFCQIFPEMVNRLEVFHIFLIRKTGIVEQRIGLRRAAVYCMETAFIKSFKKYRINFADFF